MISLLFFLLTLCVTLGAPFPVLDPDTPHPATAGRNAFVCANGHRSTVRILWSCLAVIAASTWVCVHPNVTGYQTSWQRRLKARLRLFALAVFAPEAIAMFAFAQWRGSRTLYQDVAKKAKGLEIGKPKWTYVHAHFLQMGGIVFKNGDIAYFAEPGMWEDEQIKAFFHLGLTEADVVDKSKAQGLPMTLLEATCLAFIVFNLGMYYFWWDKPLNVACPFEVTCPSRLPSSGSGGERMEQRTLMTLIRLFLPIEYEVLSDVIMSAGSWPISGQPVPATKSYPSFYWSSCTEDKHCSAAPTCYATIALVVASASLGALHTMAWSFQFPTPAEQQIWRCCCLVLVCPPMVDHEVWAVWDVLALAGMFVLMLGAICYTVARLILIVLPFVQLRNLPVSTHVATTWADILPHI
ncbi:hypothetical protein NMY22_g18104 [Coprinellus aureogranulatus]|nr:hypothetical protein NMY22_g18104 [Coprinellus aureogranulatus]